MAPIAFTDLLHLSFFSRTSFLYGSETKNSFERRVHLKMGRKSGGSGYLSKTILSEKIQNEIVPSEEVFTVSPSYHKKWLFYTGIATAARSEILIALGMIRDGKGGFLKGFLLKLPLSDSFLPIPDIDIAPPADAYCTIR